VKAETDNHAEVPGIPVRPSEGEFIIQLEEARNTQTLPLCEKCLADRLSLLGLENLQGDCIAVSIDKVATVETGATGEIAWSNKIQLLEHSWGGYIDLGIWGTMTSADSLAPQVVTSDDAVDGPSSWQRIDSQLAQLPLDGHSPSLGILVFQ